MSSRSCSSGLEEHAGLPFRGIARGARYGDVMVTVSDERIAGLPAPVRRSLHRSGVAGVDMPAAVMLRQRGEILLRDRWFPFTANQEYSLDPPGFVWRATVRLAGLPFAFAEDALESGRGRMHVRVLGLVPVVDATGREMDQGALMRWLNETMWFPQVWATDLISWQPIDDSSATGRVSAGGLTAGAEFRFDGDGRFVDFRADRYRATDSGFELARWATPITAHASFGGIEVPSAGRARWLLDRGELEYIRLQITNIHYVANEPGGAVT